MRVKPLPALVSSTYALAPLAIADVPSAWLQAVRCKSVPWTGVALCCAAFCNDFAMFVERIPSSGWHTGHDGSLPGLCVALL